MKLILDHARHGRRHSADAQYFFTEDVLGHTSRQQPRQATTCQNIAVEFTRLQNECIVGFRELIGKVSVGAYPGPEQAVPIDDAEFEAFLGSFRDSACGDSPLGTAPQELNLMQSSFPAQGLEQLSRQRRARR